MEYGAGLVVRHTFYEPGARFGFELSGAAVVELGDYMPMDGVSLAIPSRGTLVGAQVAGAFRYRWVGLGVQMTAGWVKTGATELQPAVPRVVRRESSHVAAAVIPTVFAQYEF